MRKPGDKAKATPHCRVQVSCNEARGTCSLKLQFVGRAGHETRVSIRILSLSSQHISGEQCKAFFIHVASYNIMLVLT